MAITTVKQDAFINAEALENWSIKIFGLGSIGGELVKQSALVGFKDITGYDFDVVEGDNIGSQVYTKNEIGMKKTEAIKKIMNEYIL